MKRNPENTYKNPTPEDEARKAFIQRMLSMPLKKGVQDLTDVSNLHKKEPGEIIRSRQDSEIKQKRQKKKLLMSQIRLQKTSDGKINILAIAVLVNSNKPLFIDSRRFKQSA